ncbi:hypothetical protein [Nocardia cyriacigeorgica]|uniref:hypothetical protein n=1 Tax=Nocardia cyriacigeorgica TaxID=135487 RepID=UPI001E64B70B|nr:hypothetical protein [Nocardia cyriacigeorgica]
MYAGARPDRADTFVRGDRFDGVVLAFVEVHTLHHFAQHITGIELRLDPEQQRAVGQVVDQCVVGQLDVVLITGLA